MVKETAADVSHGSNGKSVKSEFEVTVVNKNTVSEHRESDMKVKKEYVTVKPHESA